MIAADTNVLIDARQGRTDPALADRVTRARSLVNEASKANIEIVLPSIVVSEYLAWFDDAARPAQRSALEANFKIMPFDLNAAELAAAIDKRHRAAGTARLAGVSRACLRVDVMILATAIAAGAKALYTSDERVAYYATFASGSSIKIEPLPIIAPPATTTIRPK
ncbi:MAG: type II toxin-antitoxin system VapC family toxin [Ktedonobacterales bacterium]